MVHKFVIPAMQSKHNQKEAKTYHNPCFAETRYGSPHNLALRL